MISFSTRFVCTQYNVEMSVSDCCYLRMTAVDIKKQGHLPTNRLKCLRCNDPKKPDRFDTMLDETDPDIAWKKWGTV